MDGAFTDRKSIASYSNRNYSIVVSTGKYGTNNSIKHSIFPVAPGNIVRVTAPNDYSTRFCFVTSTDTPSSGGNIPLCIGHAVVEIAAGTSAQFQAPSDAVAFLVYRGSSPYDNTPASLSVEIPAIDKSATIDNAKEADVAAVKLVADAALNKEEYTKEVIDLSQLPEQNLSFTESAYNSTGKFKQFYVNPGDVVVITGGTNDGTCGFKSTISAPYSGSTTGIIELFSVPSGKTRLFRAGSTALAFAFNISMTGTDDVAPAAISVYRVEEKASFRIMSAARWGYSSGVLAYVAYSTTRNLLVRVKAGHTYAVFPVANAGYRLDFITDIPYAGLGYTAGNLDTTGVSAAIGIASCTITPATDGYLYTRVYKSSSPNASITVYDITAAAGDQSVINDNERIVLNGKKADSLIENTMTWKQVKMNSFTQRSRVIIGGTGLYGTATTSKHILVPVKPGQFVKIVRSGPTATSVAFFTDAANSSDYGVPSYVPGTSVILVVGTKVLTVPEGCNYLYVSNAYPPDYLAITEDYASLPPVVRENDADKTKRILDQLVSKTRYERDNNTANKPLILLHFSDIHGMSACLDRINQYRNYWKGYIDDTIQTGDVQEDRWENDFIFGEASADNPNNDILSVIGNHDTATGTGDNRVWHDKQGKPSYDRYIAPFVDYWDVEQPENAAEYGYCFYYKDYTDSHVRLIVLDAWNSETSYIDVQKEWLQSVLTEAREAGLSVLLASHFALQSETLLDTTFSKLDAAVENPDSSIYNNPYKSIVTDFVANGGELIGWICGHAHYDAVRKTSVEQGSQISFCVANACRNYTGSTELWITNSMIDVVPDDYKTQNLFNLIAIDVVYKTVSLFRVGSNWDKLGRRIETSCIKYTTGEVIY